jgi:iron complex transport system substrate-binding protein
VITTRIITRGIFCLFFLAVLSFTGCGGAAAASSGTVTIVDYTGKSVEVPSPVETVISLSSYASEILCALDGGDKIVGRDSYSIYPPDLEDVTIVGQSSYSPNVELILELDPDVIIADTMLSDDNREKIESGGLPVIVIRSGDPKRTMTIIRDLGTILDRNERAEELVAFIDRYHSIVEERTADLDEEDKPVVLGEWASPWNAATPGTGFGDKIAAAGGICITADETPGTYVVVSSEWVAERKPNVIIFQKSGKNHTREGLEETRDEILSRPGLSDVDAVKDGRVYVVTSGVMGGAPSIISDLHFAKWFHLNLFGDIDPEEVHEELVQEFFGLELEGVYVYP